MAKNKDPKKKIDFKKSMTRTLSKLGNKKLGKQATLESTQSKGKESTKKEVKKKDSKTNVSEKSFEEFSVSSESEGEKINRQIEEFKHEQEKQKKPKPSKKQSYSMHRQLSRIESKEYDGSSSEE